MTFNQEEFETGELDKEVVVSKMEIATPSTMGTGVRLA